MLGKQLQASHIHLYFLNFTFNYVHMCVLMNAGSYRDKRKALDSPQLELQGIGNCLTWVLGREPGSFGRAVHVLHC